MASSSTWKSSLSVLDRYEVVQRLQAALGAQAMSEASTIEQAAYNNSSTREEYDIACIKASTAQSHPSTSLHLQHPPSSPVEPGLRIGPFPNCTYISEGITSQVFRSGDKALKVILPQQQSLEPHNPQREVKILRTLHPPCIPLLDVFRDQEQRLVLVFPYMPLTLQDLLDKNNTTTTAATLTNTLLRTIFSDVLHALEAIHSQGIIHRDIKPSAILLASPTGPAHLSDFGTAWHPSLSTATEPASSKILDIGTGAYRAPEVLFGNKAYTPAIDMWGLGVMLAEAARHPEVVPGKKPLPLLLFESRPAHEDGSQLGLILSIFKTLGTPTPETWPEALEFKVTPFEMWTVFPPRSWEEILPDVEPVWRELVAALVKYDGTRASAAEALTFPCFTDTTD